MSAAWLLGDLGNRRQVLQAHVLAARFHSTLVMSLAWARVESAMRLAYQRTLVPTRSESSIEMWRRTGAGVDVGDCLGVWALR